MIKLAARHPVYQLLQPILLYLLASLVITTASRLMLMVWLHQRVQSVGGVWFILLQGLRFDLVLQGLLLALPLLLTPLMATHRNAWPGWNRVLRIYLVACIAFVAFMELATPAFIMEYDLRPNILFVEYLEYPQEVFSMLWAGYKLPIFIAAVVLPLVVRLAWRRIAPIRQPSLRISVPLALLLAPTLLLVSTVMWRSSFDHRPVNPSDVAFSTDPLMNMLPMNSGYTVLYALYEWRKENAGVKYGNIPEEEVIGVMHAMSGAPESAFVDDQLPTLHLQTPAVQSTDTPKNLVIILEESLGAGFVGALGGLPLTPNLDRLYAEGIHFTELYATGTRSVRGIEAVLTGFLPTTSESVVKLGGSQQDFFTLAGLLQRDGYDTSFIYGGSAQFDNMRRFFVNNGFDTIIDEQDYGNPVFEGSWGVSDEDLFMKAHEIFSAHEHGKPFFSLVFTSSNHTPFEYPEGRITPYNEPAATRENAIRYADHALGRFFEIAKRSAYWNDTIFLVIADHDSRVFGEDLVPIPHYRIPGVILGGNIAPRRIDRLASQVDMLPTLLSLLGRAELHPATGIDLLSDAADKVPPHVVMQYGDNIAYRQQDDVIVFRKDKPALQFRYVNGKLLPNVLDPALLRVALAHTEWPRLAYLHKWYHLPSPETAGGP